MFFKHFIRAVVVGFGTAVIVAVALLSEYTEPEMRQVDFTTAPSNGSGFSTPAGALEVARDYAREHGLTDCVDPAHARLDDVILTYPDEPRAGTVITLVGFDEALRSGELGRWNVLACRAPDHTL